MSLDSISCSNSIVIPFVLLAIIYSICMLFIVFRAFVNGWSKKNDVEKVIVQSHYVRGDGKTIEIMFKALMRKT